MSQQQIKVVKRAARSGPHDARSQLAELSVNEEARALAATVSVWVCEFRRTRLKQHQEMVKNVRRGDTVSTSGGLVGKVTKVVDDDQIEVEIAEGVRVRQVRAMVSDVRAKGEPVKDEAAAS